MRVSAPDLQSRVAQEQSAEMGTENTRVGRSGPRPPPVYEASGNLRRWRRGSTTMFSVGRHNRRALVVCCPSAWKGSPTLCVLRPSSGNRPGKWHGPSGETPVTDRLEIAAITSKRSGRSLDHPCFGACLILAVEPPTGHRRAEEERLAIVIWTRKSRTRFIWRDGC